MAKPSKRDREVLRDMIKVPIAQALPILATYREEIEARAPEQGGEMREALTSALAWLTPYLRHLRAKNDPRALSLTNKLADFRTLLACDGGESTEKRGPEVGDIVMLHFHCSDRAGDDFWEPHLWGGSVSQRYIVGSPVIIMRRAKVEARIKELRP